MPPLSAVTTERVAQATPCRSSPPSVEEGARGERCAQRAALGAVGAGAGDRRFAAGGGGRFSPPPLGGGGVGHVVPWLHRRGGGRADVLALRRDGPDDRTLVAPRLQP